jgi:hypothetical protein
MSVIFLFKQFVTHRTYGEAFGYVGRYIVRRFGLWVVGRYIVTTYRHDLVNVLFFFVFSLKPFDNDTSFVACIGRFII